MVSVAQLVEHRSVAPRVAGSNPVAHPNTLLTENKTTSTRSCIARVSEFLHNHCTRAGMVRFFACESARKNAPGMRKRVVTIHVYHNEPTGQEIQASVLVLLCHKRREQQNGQQASCFSRNLASRIRSVAIECGLCRSARTRFAARPELGRRIFPGRVGPIESQMLKSVFYLLGELSPALVSGCTLLLNTRL